jgi:Rod binding domain-containing protein
MEFITGAIGAAQGQSPPDPTVRPRNVAEAASQFEALLIGHVLKEMRSSGGEGWLGGGEDASAATILEVAEEQLSRALASQGGLGLSPMIEQEFRASPDGAQGGIQEAKPGGG